MNYCRKTKRDVYSCDHYDCNKSDGYYTITTYTNYSGKGWISHTKFLIIITSILFVELTAIGLLKYFGAI